MSTFPDAPLDITVELQIGGVWTDITSDVRTRDSITITRGRPDEASTSDPSAASFSLRNTGGKYSPRNPASPYYGLLGRNTPVRITAAGSVRFVGEVASWPVRWDTSGHDVHAQIEAAGIGRRLGQGAKALSSALSRSISAAAPYAAWWPLEDAPGSSRAAAGYSGLAPMRISGGVTFTGEASGGVAGGVSFGSDGRLYGSVPAAPADWSIACWINVPADAKLDGSDVPPILDWTTPNAPKSVTWDLWYTAGILTLESADVTNTIVVAKQGNVNLRGAGPSQLLVTGQQSGTNVAVTVEVNGVVVMTASSPADAVSPVAAVGLNMSGVPGQSGSASHLIVAPASRAASLRGHVPAGSGYRGETAAARIVRVAAEEGVTVDVVGTTAADSTALGPQGLRTMLELLDEAADADAGTLHERRDALAYRYRPRAADYNTPAAVTLDYAAGQISAPLEPVDDDQAVRNDVTVSREGGSSARVVQTTGPLSAVPPPSGVGVYDESLTLSLADDGQLAEQAGWRVRLGTVDEARYPTVPLRLHRHPSLISAVTALDIRSHVRLINLPSWLPPGPIDALVTGYTEVLEPLRWTIDLTTTPASPYTVAVADDTTRARVDTDGSWLDAAAPAAATSLLVGSSGAPWTTTPAEFPFDLRMGPEVVRATAVGNAVNDTFNRTTTNGWGNTPEGVAWTPVTGAAGDYSATVDTFGNWAQMSITTRFSDRTILLDMPCGAVDIQADYRTLVSPIKGDTVYYYVLAHYNAAAPSWYALRIGLYTDGTTRVAIETGPPDYAVLAPETNLPLIVVGAMAPYRARFKVGGGLLQGKVWPVDMREPDWQVSASDTRYTSGRAGLKAYVPTANTNPLPFQAQWANVLVRTPQRMTATRAVNGIPRDQPSGTALQLATPPIIAL